MVGGAAFAAQANDAASSIAAGGVVLRSEPRISMQKERLTIRSLGPGPANLPRFKVEVEYEFVNATAEDVVTEVAFPVPAYAFHLESLEGPFDLGGFKAWVDGKEIRVAKEVRALVEGRDQAPVLRALGIDVEHHGHYSADSDAPRNARVDQIRGLSAADAARLVQLGLIEDVEPDGRWPQWSVETTWHWTQRFPAGATVRVRHEYTPAAGFRYGSDARALTADLPAACPDESLVRALEKRKEALDDGARRAGSKHGAMIFAAWVDYILTTANTWKTPIRDFELRVERPGGFVSFCWDGKVEKESATTFVARAKDFVPGRELSVHFFTVE
jgi:hypothetical protein